MFELTKSHKIQPSLTEHYYKNISTIVHATTKSFVPFCSAQDDKFVDYELFGVLCTLEKWENVAKTSSYIILVCGVFNRSHHKIQPLMVSHKIVFQQFSLCISVVVLEAIVKHLTV